ncbi:HEPN domain-containing protein [Paraburkholderia pallida]|uniref:Uncharacterized protein n=1 Tax=Paraburkholderia pallida TaxID=2547399 RepID=A0A4P7DBW3_9BURK|nr:HEPN domain-containing protein [Paraburkholderia pallida]QBR04222.1 hypothetical protein E1956_44665 [Paraburkholderia pallida]
MSSLMPREDLVRVLTELLLTKDPTSLRFAFPGDSLGYMRIHVPEEFREAVAAIPEVKEREGHMLNHGSMAATVQPGAIAEGLVHRAIQTSPADAVADLYRFFEQDYSRCVEVCLLRGISVKEQIELSNEIFLGPLAAVPSDSLQQFIARRSMGAAVIPGMTPVQVDEKRPPLEAALYRLKEVRPKWFRQPVNGEPLPFVQDAISLTAVANLLTLIGPSSPFIVSAYTELADGELLKGRTGFSWNNPPEETRIVENVAVSTEEIRDLLPTIRSYLALPERIEKQLQVPLHRLNEAVRHRNSVDRALDLGIALESLLLSQQQSKDQLSLQFRLRGAWLLGKDGNERTALYKQLETLYTYRSLAAHSGAVEPSKTPAAEVEATLKDGLRLCASAIRRVIDSSGYPDWSRLLVGADYTIDTEAAT